VRRPSAYRTIWPVANRRARGFCRVRLPLLRETPRRPFPWAGFCVTVGMSDGVPGLEPRRPTAAGGQDPWRSPGVLGKPPRKDSVGPAAQPEHRVPGQPPLSGLPLPSPVTRALPPPAPRFIGPAKLRPACARGAPGPQSGTVCPPSLSARDQPPVDLGGLCGGLLPSIVVYRPKPGSGPGPFRGYRPSGRRPSRGLTFDRRGPGRKVHGKFRRAMRLGSPSVPGRPVCLFPPPLRPRGPRRVPHPCSSSAARMRCRRQPEGLVFFPPARSTRACPHISAQNAITVPDFPGRPWLFLPIWTGGPPRVFTKKGTSRSALFLRRYRPVGSPGLGGPRRPVEGEPTGALTENRPG